MTGQERSDPVRIEADAAMRIMYVALRPSEPDAVARTQDFGRVRLDFDAEGEVYGIEIDGDLGLVEIVDAPVVTFNPTPFGGDQS